MKKIFIIGTLIICAFSLKAQESFTNPNTSNVVKVNADTILYKHQYEPLIKERDKLKRDTVNFNNTIKILIKEKQTLKNELDSLSIDKFLNRQDTFIFGVEFLSFEKSSIPKRNQAFYSLISNIKELNDQLSTIETTNISQLSSIKIKESLEKAGQLIDDINDSATQTKGKITDYLSDDQKQFFRNLVDRYNKIITDISNIRKS